MTCTPGMHDLKISVLKGVLPDVYYCTKCPLILTPLDAAVSAMKDIISTIDKEITTPLKDSIKDIENLAKENRGMKCPECDCKGNFHMHHIRKQYTKVETCSECGHL